MNLELMLPLCIYLVLVLGSVSGQSPPDRRQLHAGVLHRQPQHGGLVLAMTLVATYTSASSFIGGPGAAYKVGLGWVLLAMIQLPTVWLTLGCLARSSPSSPAGSTR